MPWLKGEDALNIIRDYVNLRYRLLPTYYNLSHENYETGMPLVRRLDFEYPEYESAARNDPVPARRGYPDCAHHHRYRGRRSSGSRGSG